MDYLVYATFAAVSYGFYNFFVGKTENKISPLLGPLLLYLTSAMVAITAILIQKHSAGKILVTPAGIKFAVLAGLMVGVAEIFYFTTYTKNINVSIVLPTVMIITAITGTILGFTLNHEPITLFKIIGISLAIIALLLLSK